MMHIIGITWRVQKKNVISGLLLTTIVLKQKNYLNPVKRVKKLITLNILEIDTVLNQLISVMSTTLKGKFFNVNIAKKIIITIKLLEYV